MKNLLHTWARWAADTGIHHLAYKGHTVEYDLMQFGGGAPVGTGRNPVDEQQWAIEKAVNELSPQYRQFILAEFLAARLQGRKLKPKDRAALVGLNSVSGYYARLQVAIALVAGKVL